MITILQKAVRMYRDCEPEAFRLFWRGHNSVIRLLVHPSEQCLVVYAGRQTLLVGESVGLPHGPSLSPH